MGGGETELLELQEENARLRSSITELESQLQQSESTKLQLKKSYEEALQTLADSEAKRETVDKELRLAHDQISSMWKELESLRKQVEGGSTHEAEPIPLAQINEHHGGMENGRMGSTSSNNSIINESFLELQCTLCKEKINKSVSSLHTITSESTQCTCSHSTTNLAGTNHPDRNERARSLGAEQRFQVTKNGNGTQTQAQAQTKPSPKGSPKMQQRSRRGSWLFGRKQQQRVQDLEAHSKVCSSHSNTKPAPSNSHTPSPKLMKKSTSSPSTSRPHSRSNSPLKKSSPRNSAAIMEEYLVINVTRSSHGATDLTPFKVVTKTNLPSFSQSITEVYRSQGDFQWLYEALQEACPERIIPPLKPPISLDATMSEFQRFLSRISTHKILRKQHHFIVFLTGTAEELRSLRAKHRPRRRGDKIQYKPAVGRDTNTGTLVATKDYLTTLEQNINGLVSHLEQSVRRKAGADRTGHWFRAISESEPDVTYLKTAAADLSRTCEATECQHSDSDETLFIHNLQSVADFVRAAQDLLTRVEEAVDRFLYWDEEISIIEAVTNSPMAENTPAENSEDVVFDDSGVSDVTGSSNRSNSDGHTQTSSHVTSQDSASNISEEGISMGEKWAQASKHCADAKDYLEMMCRDMTEELAHFDLQKEKELKQVLLEYTAAQLERHEKFRGKWFAMKFLLDTPISPDKRAIQFSNASSTTEDATAGDSAEQIAEGTRDSH